MAEIRLREFTESDAEALTAFLTGNDWPFHVRLHWSPEQVATALADGSFHSAGVRTLWLTADAADVGMAVVSDLDKHAPMLDIRLAVTHRGRGYGSAALRAVTTWLFATDLEPQRFEGQTRVDNIAMRKTFLRCGWVKEAHYRAAWPTHDGQLVDSVGYGLLRSDWLSGQSTPVDWFDDPAI
jgi:RimJ/RimL family protein N-acetyltransferase